MKAQVDYLDISELVNASTSSNNLKTTVDYLDIDTLKTVSIDLKKLIDAGIERLLKTQNLSN